MSHSTRSQILKFLLVGSTTVVVDFSIYSSFLYFGALVSVSKGIGFLIGTIFAYFANKHFTFKGETEQKAAWASFILIYSATLIINVSVNSFIIYLTAKTPLFILIAFIISTGISATLNFLGMKFFVFNSHSKMREVIYD